MAAFRLLAFVALVLSGPAAAQKLPEPRENDLTLDEARALPSAAFAARLDALMGEGYHGVDAFLNGWGMHATYRSPRRPVGRGVCEATQVTFFWEPETTQPPYGDPRFPSPPPDAGTAPLKLRRHQVETVFHRLDDARAARSARWTRMGCILLNRYAHFVAAEDAETFVRAASILANVQGRLAGDPASIEVECSGWPDCVDRIRRVTLNELQSISGCGVPSEPGPPDCLRFNLPPDTGPTMVGTKGFEVETEGGGALRIRRIRWRATMFTS